MSSSMEQSADIAALKARLDGMDRAIDLLQKNADKSPTTGELAERMRNIDMQMRAGWRFAAFVVGFAIALVGAVIALIQFKF
jgi:hypothetical protein